MVRMRDCEVVEAAREPPLSRPAGHPLPALRGEGRERGANLVHGPNACAKANEGSP